MKSRRSKTVPHPDLLRKYQKEISRCVRCGSCGGVCPTYLNERDESYSARGRMALISAVSNGRLAVSGIYKDRLAACTTCLACEAACPSGVPVMEIIQAAKEQAVAESGRSIIGSLIAGAIRHPALMKAAVRLAPVVLHYSRQSPGSGGQRINSKFKIQDLTKTARRCRVAFFPGCAIENFQPDIQDATIGVLNAIGYEVIVPADMRCCGRPLLSLGDRRAAEECARRNAALFEALDVDAIVTACASCGLTFQKEYPQLLPPAVKTPAVLDIHDFLAGRIAGIKLNPVNKSVTIHDPCHLGRGQGLSQTVRDVLQAIPGLALVKMRDPDRCCGFGGVMRITHRELSDDIAESKLKNIFASGAAVVATGCPGCRMQIAAALRRHSSEIGVVHPVHLLEEALSIKE